MIKGNIDRINLTTSSFERMITEDLLYVDKTKLIENFLTSPNFIHLVVRQRRLGKSLNMDMLRCFLTDKEDSRHLFKGLYVESSQVWDKVNSAPVFYFNFKGLQQDTYKRAIYDKICDYIDSYCTDTDLSRATRRYLSTDDFNNASGIKYLTESVYKATGKRSYVLIDEYDKLLMESYNSNIYEDIRSFKTSLFSAGLKDNPYLEKALLTGVMRISNESMFSGLNNIVTYDVFRDNVYTDDYGLTEAETKALSTMKAFDIDEAATWYNGITISGKPIYNIYALLSYLSHGEYGCYWGKSGTMDMIADLLDDERRATIAKLLNGERVTVPIVNRISLRDLSGKASDRGFYSLLVQAGYLALCTATSDIESFASVSIPNMELQIVWKQFILEKLYPNTPRIRTLFDNITNMDVFSKNLEYFLCDRLSYHDLAVNKDENIGRLQERLYHIFLLGILSAYDDTLCQYPLSNRESGSGRYDVLVQKHDTNFIFEFKAGDNSNCLAEKAQAALNQIEAKRYGADLNPNKRLVKVGIAFFGKLCCVVSCDC